MTQMLSDDVTVARRFRRSIRIGADADQAGIDGFVCTATAAQALATTIDHVGDLKHSAFTWTGPYGCGKSTLALVLAAALGPKGPMRQRARACLPESLAERLDKGLGWRPQGWRVVPVVGRRDDAARLVGAAAAEAGIAGPDVIAALVEAAEASPCGVLLIIDEMGKLLEHAASGEGDAHFFQELAEAAARSSGRLIVIGVLHQAFDDYAYRLARETRDDWLKVQGRFVDVPLAPTAEEQVELLARAIESAPPSIFPEAIAVAALAARSTESREIVEARLRSCWPLNPVVACLLGPLSRRRFGQNQRSIFGFLGSAEPQGFQDFLRSTPSASNSLYNPVWLWSYLRANLEPSILASPDGHRWSIAVDAVERVEERGGDAAELSVLKTVALLDLFRERSGLAATCELVAAALSLATEEVDAVLATLVQRSALVFRRHLGAYAVYAGSDFDIEAAVEEARAQMSGCDYGRLRATGVLTPILAKRAYHETGAMRWFEVDVATLEQAEQRAEAFKADNAAAGLFLLLINENSESTSRIRRVIERLYQQVGDRPIAFGVSGDSYMLRELSHELIALESVQINRPELKGDPVARREVASRLARVAGELEDRLRSGLGALSWHSPALGDQELRGVGSAGLSIIASQMATSLYPQTPKLKNELVNRAKPSSNAMAAVRLLMAAMATRSDQPRLGISDFPAEGGLYASLLERTGLHGPTTDGSFGFRAPLGGENSDGLASLWLAGRALLEERGPDGLGLDELFAIWRARPFGVKQGLLPILGLAFLLTERPTLSVYLDGIFCSDVSDLLVDRLLQDHDAVRLRLSMLSERDSQILRGVADLVVELSNEQGTRAMDPLVVGRGLVALVMNAPGWVRRTSRLSKAALRVRDLAQSAHDPNKFVLDDLPRIAGQGATTEAIVAELRAGLEQLAVTYPTMLDSLRDLVLQELRSRSTSGLKRLRERAKAVMGLTGNYRLDAFAARLSTYDGSTEAIEGLASLAANRPPRDWVDRDVDAARVELAALAREFLRAEGFAHVQGKGDARFAFALLLSDPARDGLITPELTIDNEDLVRARELARSLRSVIGDKVGRDIALAAAIELAAGLAEENDVFGDTPVCAAGGTR